MNIKRILLLILAALLLTPSALAAQGDANLLDDDPFFDAHSGFPDGGCVFGDALVLYTYKQFYSWRPGDKAPSVADYELPGASGGEERRVARLFSANDQLYALCGVYSYEGGDFLNLIRLEIAPVYIDGDSASFGEAVQAPVNGLTENYGAGEELATVYGALAAGDKLYLDIWTSSRDRKLYAQPLDGGAGEFLEVENLSGIAAYDKGLLIQSFDSSAKRCDLWILDPESGALSSACALLEREAALDNIVYSAESGRLFYLDGGYIMAAQDFDFAGAQPVSELMARYLYGSASFLLPGDIYAFVSMYDGILVRATETGALPDAQIVVQGGGLFGPMVDAHYDFNAGHSDAVVVLREDYSDDDAILNDILSRDDSVDVHVTMVDSALYDALRRRGYLAPLDDASIAEEIRGMYPAAQDALTLDGEIVAVPVYVGGWTIGIDYEGFEKLGISDVPDNWSDFLDLLSTVPELLPEDGSIRVFPEYNTQKQIRIELVNQVLDSWLMHLRLNGEEPRYDDPTLAALLHKVMALNLDALGVDPGREDEEYVQISMSDGLVAGDRNYTLVNTNVDCTLTGLGYNMPAMLSVVPGEEAPLPLDLAVLFINPFSKHMELAQEYLAAVCKRIDEMDLYSLDPSLNEPVPRSGYERIFRQLQDQLDQAKEQLEAADEADKPHWQETVDSCERQIADLELNRWMISPEKIEWYRAHGDRLMVRQYSYVQIPSEDGEFTDLTEQFMGGRIDAADFLREIDRKVQMRMREG